MGLQQGTNGLAAGAPMGLQQGTNGLAAAAATSQRIVLVSANTNACWVGARSGFCCAHCSAAVHMDM